MLNSDSVLLSKDSLNNLIAPFNDPNVVATVGRQIPRHDAEDWVRRDYDVAFQNKAIPDFIGLSFPLSAFRLDAWKKKSFIPSHGALRIPSGVKELSKMVLEKLNTFQPLLQCIRIIIIFHNYLLVDSLKVKLTSLSMETFQIYLFLMLKVVAENLSITLKKVTI